MPSDPKQLERTGRSSSLKPFLAAACFGAFALIFAVREVYNRVAIDVHGKIIVSATTCVQPSNNRCSTRYIIENATQHRSEYVAGPTDSSLRRRLAVGTSLEKSKWALAYKMDGQPINDFSTTFYEIVGSVGFGFCWWAVLLYRMQRQI
jgi:hypothetical protein